MASSFKFGRLGKSPLGDLGVETRRSPQTPHLVTRILLKRKSIGCENKILTGILKAISLRSKQPE